MLTTLQLSKGQTVAFQDAGHGPTVILIHGVGMQSAAWEPQIAAMKVSYRTIAVDLPGHGASDPIPTDSALPAYVAWLDDVISRLECGAAAVVGHSMGALIAAGFAIEHPDQTAGVALLNGVFRRDARARDAVIARSEEIAAGHFDLETPLDRWFGASLTDVRARAQVADWLGSVDLSGYATAYRAFARGDAIYADRFREITCPLLALTGADDPNSTPAMAQAMAQAAPLGTAISVDGQRHMVNLTAADTVNKHLTSWLLDVTSTAERLR